MKKIGKQIWGYQKNWENSRFYEKKLDNKCHTKKEIGEKSAGMKILGLYPKKVQILNVSNIVDKNIVPIFEQVWKFWVYTQM